MAKSYVVLTGALSLAEGEAKYKGNIVTDAELGDQLKRHLDNKAVREATTYEVKAGKANPEGEPTLEDQIDEAKAQIESAESRIKQLETQVSERDGKLKPKAKTKAEIEAEEKAKAEAEALAKKNAGK